MPAQSAAARLLIFLVAFLVFLPSLRHELITDDPLVIDNARRIVASRGLGGLLTTRYYVSHEKEETQYYRPMTYLALWLGGTLGERKAFALHGFNAALHALNAVLLHHLLRSLAFGPGVALAAALLFAVHPAHVETVTAAAGVGDLLATAFALGACVMFARSVLAGGAVRPGRLAAGLALFLAATLSKENALLLPAVLLAAATVLRPAGSGSLAAAARRTAAWWLGFLAVGAIALALRAASGVGWTPAASPNRDLLVGQPQLAAWVWLKYFEFLVLPVRLSPYHKFQGFDAQVVLAGALFLLLVLWALARPATRRPAVAAGLWLLVFLFPASGFFHSGELVAERFLYLPSAGFCLLVPLALWPAAPQSAGRRRLLFGGAALALGLLAAQCLSYQGRWKNNATVNASYRETYGTERAGTQGGWKPADPRAMNNIAIGMIRDGELDQAEHLLLMATKADPGLWSAHANLGALRVRQDRWEEAEQSFLRAAELNEDDPDIWVGLGDSRRALGRRESAAAAYRRALALDPGNAAALAGLAAAGE